MKASAFGWWRRLAQEASCWLDEIYPATCRLCGQPALDGVACADHRLLRRRSRPRCGRCAARLAPMLPDAATCADCRWHPPPFARVRLLGDYRESALPDWILALKHGGRRDLAQPLAAMLVAQLGLVAARGGVSSGHASSDGVPSDGVSRAGDWRAGDWSAGDWSAGDRSTGDRAASVRLPAGAWITPIPAHALRLLERGYDQARLLAQELARLLDGELRCALWRARHTPPQGAAGSSSRTANVRAAFRLDADCRRALLGREVFLVDDVVTSGATVAEATRVLRRAGARRVEVLCLARAGPAPGSGPGPEAVSVRARAAARARFAR